MKENNYAVYIITNYNRTTFYVGVTGNLEARLVQHIYKVIPDSFSSKYHLNRLVYYEFYDYINDAIAREKQLKNWHRQWKINLIQQINPDMIDLLTGEE
ncbi:MAG: GIY-YIG nuclease family protein [Heliobacteriaceae bacterium]|jgi:putative endonuclease|nr:GIY-YIG nuclease family protein [Heliobacteriaceae bacterium]